MARPSWLAYGFAVLMVAVSVYCIGRLLLASRLGRRNHTAVNVSHVLMGIAMVFMLIPRWNFLPNGLWEITFSVMALYFLWRTVQVVARRGVSGITDDETHRVPHPLIHMVMACAMLYMYWLGMPLTGGGGGSMGMSGPPRGAGDPGLTLFIIAILVASAIWQLDSVERYSRPQLVATTVSSSGTGGGVAQASGTEGVPLLAPRLEILCHVAMCLTMGYMLVLMV